MISRWTTHYPRRVLALAAALFVVFVAAAAGTMDALSLNRYEAAASESMRARQALAGQFGTGSPNVAILITAADGTVDNPEVRTIGEKLTSDLAAYPGVGDAWSYWSPQAPDTLASTDRSHALLLAWVPGDANLVRGHVLPAIKADLIAPLQDPAVTVQLGGADETFRAVAAQSRTDFLRSEFIVLPLVGLLLWAVYRRLAPALVTLGVGLFSVAGTLALLRVVTMFTEISTFASNIGLVMGIGLGVDYSLFVIYRFREELRRGLPVPDAVRRTVASAGRTVIFSGATVAASLSVLLIFPFPFLSSFAYAGIAVVGTALLGSLIALPAALTLLGHRVDRKGAAPSVEAGFWHRVTSVVMRRPVMTGSAGLLVLLALAAPALGVNFGSPDDRILPAGQPIRAMYDTIRADFVTEDADAIHVVAPAADLSEVPGYATALSMLPGVERVDSAAGAFVAGTRVGDAGPLGSERFTDGTGTWLAVLPTGDRLAADPTGLVWEVRAVTAPFDVLVGGYPADLTDYRDGVVERLPVVGLLILVVTFVVLFLMTGSVIAPIKASVLNLLSLGVMFGVLVWGFQDGGFAPLLGFTPTGTIEPSIPILMFCVAYGLSMDYEVFLLARIKEDYDRTHDAVGSVPRGIARSAPLVSAAALILAASFAVYSTSEVTFLQMLSFCMAAAIVVDATIIRGVVMPAFMRLAGHANWWAPAPLRRFHQRFGWREEPALETPSAVDDRIPSLR